MLFLSIFALEPKAAAALTGYAHNKAIYNYAGRLTSCGGSSELGMGAKGQLIWDVDTNEITGVFTFVLGSRKAVSLAQMSAQQVFVFKGARGKEYTVISIAQSTGSGDPFPAFESDLIKGRRFPVKIGSATFQVPKEMTGLETFVDQADNGDPVLVQMNGSFVLDVKASAASNAAGESVADAATRIKNSYLAKGYQDADLPPIADGGGSPGNVASSNCVSWWKADSLSLSDGASVSSWPNSATGGPTASAPSNPPVFKTNIQNGKPVVRFAGLGGMTFNASTLPNGGSDRTVTFVGYCPAITYPGPAQYRQVLQYGTLYTYGGDWVLGFNGNGQTIDHSQYGSGYQSSVAATGTWHIITVTTKGGVGTTYIDGVARGSLAMTYNTFGSAGVIGGNLPGDNTTVPNGYFTGDMAELVVYNKALSDTERQSLEGALSAKYFGSPGNAAPGNCVGWWKADALGLNDGASVSSWPNSVKGGPAATASTNQPLFKANVRNGMPVVRFDGTKYLSFAPSSMPLGSSDRTLTVVVSGSYPGSQWPVFFSYGSMDWAGAFMVSLNPPGGVFGIGNEGEGASTDNSISGAWHVVTVVSSAGHQTLYVDGVHHGDGTMTLNTASGYGFIGGHDPTVLTDSGVINFTGDIAEIAVFNKALSDAERQAAESALNAKYSVW